MKTPTNESEVKLMKSQGHSLSTIASVTGLTQGEVQRMVQSIAVYPQRHVRKTQRVGHYRESPFGTPVVVKPVKKLHKSSISPDEPAVMLEAREMLSLGIDADKVAKQLGLSRQEMTKWLGPTWQI
jgi:hypothetical protein